MKTNGAGWIENLWLEGRVEFDSREKRVANLARERSKRTVVIESTLCHSENGPDGARLLPARVLLSFQSDGRRFSG